MTATYQIDVEKIAIILANMLEQAAQSDFCQISDQEVKDDIQNSEHPSAEAGIYLHTPIEHGPGTASPGEHRAPVCSEGQSLTVGMVGGHDPDFGDEGHPGKVVQGPVLHHLLVPIPLYIPG